MSEDSNKIIDGKGNSEQKHKRAGKYLTFTLGKENYGVEILKVREIMGLIEITNVPQTPHYVRGIINLRGQVIPIMELRAKFDMEQVADTVQTCIIVVEIFSEGDSFQAGLVVDSVSEVLDIKEEQIEDTPNFGVGINTDYIMGIGKFKSDVKILLDINKVINARELSWNQESVDNGGSMDEAVSM